MNIERTGERWFWRIVVALVIVAIYAAGNWLGAW